MLKLGWEYREGSPSSHRKRSSPMLASVGASARPPRPDLSRPSREPLGESYREGPAVSSHPLRPADFGGRSFSSDIKAHPNPIVIPNGAGRLFLPLSLL